MERDELTSPRLYAVACRLTNPGDIRKLGHHLAIEDLKMNAAFQNHKFDIQEAGYAVLQEWFKDQENKSNAFITLGQALSHATVNLSSIASEALTAESVYCTKGKQ